MWVACRAGQGIYMHLYAMSWYPHAIRKACCETSVARGAYALPVVLPHRARSDLTIKCGMTVLFNVASRARVAVLSAINTIDSLVEVDFTAELTRLQARRVRTSMSDAEYANSRYLLNMSQDKHQVYIDILRAFAKTTAGELGLIAGADSGRVRAATETIISNLCNIRVACNTQLRLAFSRYGRPYLASEFSAYNMF